MAFLVPHQGGEVQRTDFSSQEELDLAGEDDPKGDDGAAADRRR
jgi:hypothetical protein